MLANYYFLPLLLTIGIELVIALFFGFKKIRNFLGIIFINIITNPLLNYALKVIKMLGLLKTNLATLLILEFLVIIIEYFLLVFAFPQRERKKLFLLSLVMNSSSALIGYYITRLSIGGLNFYFLYFLQPLFLISATRLQKK